MDKLLKGIAAACAEVKLTGFMALRPDCRFKIGKTTQTLAQRFAEKYSSQYADIELLYDAYDNGELIDAIEKEVIEFSKEAYPDRCDNDQIGGGPNCADNADRDNTAKLYVVWR